MARVMKRHDTADPITGAATAGADGTAVNLTVYGTVNFYAKGQTGGTLFGGTVSSAGSLGDWTYTQTDADVSFADVYECELECITATGLKVHFPNDKADNELLTITEDLDDT